MSDEELLQRAEDKIKVAIRTDDFLIVQAFATESIAASLLVIARNSGRTDYEKEMGNRYDPKSGVTVD